MNYQNYQLDDFLRDSDFIQWVKNPTDEQRLFWELWLAEHPDKAHTVALAKEIILSVNYKYKHQPSEADFLEVWGNIQRAEPDVESGRIIRLSSLFSSVFRYAAVWLFILTAALLVWKLSTRQTPVKSIDNQLTVHSIEQKTHRGQREKIRLPDGSLLTLNSESSITYASDFGRKERTIKLTGEAFFDVAHDKSKPFTILTGKLRTTVVGTSFNINAYTEKPEIVVTVATGKVRVSNKPENAGDSQELLLPRDQYAYKKTTETFQKQQVNLAAFIAWKDNIIVLKNANFHEIKKTLERWYAVNFVVAKGLKVREDFSARFHNAPLKNVLDALNYTSNFQYELVNNTVYVTQKKQD